MPCENVVPSVHALFMIFFFVSFRIPSLSQNSVYHDVSQIQESRVTSSLPEVCTRKSHFLIMKGIVWPFESSGESRLIRSVLIIWRSARFFANFGNQCCGSGGYFESGILTFIHPGSNKQQKRRGENLLSYLVV
jgi:hypothetical protein